ncbi:MAG: hypothetical protein ACI9Q3_000410, partial [Maribacter sp.]
NTSVEKLKNTKKTIFLNLIIKGCFYLIVNVSPDK